jgi:hypothetical protein
MLFGFMQVMKSFANKAHTLISPLGEGTATLGIARWRTLSGRAENGKDKTVTGFPFSLIHTRGETRHDSYRDRKP